MKKFKIFFVLVVVFSFALSNAQTKWKIDKAHSKVAFSVKHLVITNVEGHFKSFDGTVSTIGDTFENAKIDFSIDVNSIQTDIEARDKHLKSNDFFNANKFPKIIFKGKSFTKKSNNKYLLVGDFTIRDKTHQIKLDVTYNGKVKGMMGKTRAGFSAEGTINRFDYDLKWNKLIETGGAVVSKTVKLRINIELVQMH